ncbi:hypothetical protein NC652_032521 [Populus alba x Populus x berolinensis]|nr:hypothetical protein NC652_032521 [Populus alba x Populus x berolinensis]
MGYMLFEAADLLCFDAGSRFISFDFLAHRRMLCQVELIDRTLLFVKFMQQVVNLKELPLMLLYSEGLSLISTLTVLRDRNGRLLHLAGQLCVGVFDGQFSRYCWM